ncbi:TetR family transcriptional regulator [Streptomonospora alba]|uniref:TetR family transcriptional regulator n=1 Tax=Streptomonospora alba TaxID=183763 RepID=A0A0C2FFL4_9ACTN|nr:TetR family transcriptional regulator [Streptomonospora alba]
MAEEGSDRQFGSVFHRPERRRRAQPALSRERIVAATIALLDREGSTALTMRKVAAEIGVHATSLYWYVERREDLVDLAVDAILAEAAADLPGPEAPWDTAVRETARRYYAALTAHTWAAEFAGARPLVGPNAVVLARRIITALGELGGDEESQAVAVRAVSNQILGAATSAVAMRTSEAEFRGGQAEEAVVASTAAPNALTLPDSYFDQVLDLLVEGIRAHRAA